MDMKTGNKVWVVTGAGNGIGRELVLQLLKRGGRVAAVDRDPDALQKTMTEAGRPVHNLSVFTCDIGDRIAVEKMVSEIITRFGRVDGLINNAGIIQPFVRIKDLNYPDIERVMSVNFYGTLYMTKTLLPILMRQPEAHVVNISSMGGFLPVPGQAIYGASKAAVKLLTEALYAELANTHVHVTVVFPGAVDTEITRHSGIQTTPESSPRSASIKMVSAAYAAGRVLDGIESNAFRILVGSDSRFMDLLYRLNPEKAVRVIARKMRGLLPD